MYLVSVGVSEAPNNRARVEDGVSLVYIIQDPESIP